ncbi:unnamed protein product [Nippostrongylus brasiliensis]|uniref:DOMON domain-containing protein n=1 Tax=Nippostrongylus brasiliensis TaxID=27835 RepID=A0A0N4Y3A1_NIPBR|nr:unnamed protein product [Nippostrongylus brasiliensis]
MLLLLLVAALTASVLSDCTYKGGDVSARWQVKDNELTVEFVNKKIGNNQWTGIGFGPGMEDLEVVLVKIEDNKPTMVTGSTSGYGPPTLDSKANVAPQLLTYSLRHTPISLKKTLLSSANQLTMRFSRPLGSNGERNHSLEECQKWNFVKEGSLEDGEFKPHTTTPEQVEVCPKECTESIIHD